MAKVSMINREKRRTKLVKKYANKRAFLIMGFAILVHLVTLPVEIDASFNKALPLLSNGYLSKQQIPAARSILRAAAWTYVAASLSSLLNFWRWIALLRR